MSWSLFFRTKWWGIALCSTVMALPVLGAEISQQNSGDKAVSVTDQEIQKFVETMGREAMGVLINEKTYERQLQSFRDILDRYFNVKGIGLFLVGGEESFSRLFSQAQQEEYETLLKDYIVKIYLSKFRQYQTGSFSPDDFKVVQVTKDNPENPSKPWLVTTTVTIPGQREPLNLQWKVFHTPHGLRILDVIVEKFSMTQTKRDEFRSILLNRRADGGVAGLLNQLRAVKPAE